MSLTTATLLLHLLLEPALGQDISDLDWGDEEDDDNPLSKINHAIHCLSDHPTYSADRSGPVLQECHPIVADMALPTGSVCAEVVPDVDRPWDPALRLTFLSLTDALEGTHQWRYMEHHVWVGNTLREIPRDAMTGQLDTDRFQASWKNDTAPTTHWQTQVKIDCENKQTHTFLVLTASVATTNNHEHGGGEQCFALEYDGQGGAGWYGWMEIVVDCQCTPIEGEEQEEPEDEELLELQERLHEHGHPQDSSKRSGSSKKKKNESPFFPYGKTCEGPDLFRLKDALPNHPRQQVCWDILDSVLQTPMSRLCVDLAQQDMEETEFTVTFSSLQYSSLIQTSFWAGIHPGDHSIHSVPKNGLTHHPHSKAGGLDFQAFDQFFYDPSGLPDIVFEFRLPTDICSAKRERSNPSTAQLDSRLVMNPQGVVSIPMVAHAKTKTKMPDGRIDERAGFEEGYAMQYRFVNDQMQFGWMELNLQCGCSRAMEKEVLRRGIVPMGEEDAEEVTDEVELEGILPPAPKAPPRRPKCRSAFAFSGERPELARPLDGFGYDLFGYSNGPFEQSYEYITLDLLATEIFYEGFGDVEEAKVGEPLKVGTVKVFYDGEDASVSYSLEHDFPLKSTQLWVGKTPLPLHQSGHPNAHTAAELFDFAHQHVQEDIPNPYQDNYVIEGFDYGDSIYVMAVASDCSDTLQQELKLETDDDDDDDDDDFLHHDEAAPTHACIRSYSNCYPLTAHKDGNKIKGEVCFSLDGLQESLRVQYSLKDDLALSVAQVWVGPSLKDMPTHSDKSPNLLEFEHRRVWGGKKSSTWSVNVPIERREHCAAARHGDYDLVVVAHALVGEYCDNELHDCRSPILAETEQHVYGEETLLQKRDKWFFYIDMKIECDCLEDQFEVERLAPPTVEPTEAPTIAPTFSPTISMAPSEAPSESPTSTPMPTDAPTFMPTHEVDMKNTCIYTADGSGEYCLMLYAPNAWETSAGSVCLEMVDGELVVIYNVVSSWALAEASIWVGHDLLDVPINDEFEPDTKAFPHRHQWPEGTDTFYDVVKMDNMTQQFCQRSGAYDLFVVAHGLVAEPAISPTEIQPFVPFSEEDAYAKARPFPERMGITGDAYYVLASVLCDCDGYDSGNTRRALDELKAPSPPPSISSMLDDSEFSNTPSQSPLPVLESPDPEPLPQPTTAPVPVPLPEPPAAPVSNLKDRTDKLLSSYDRLSIPSFGSSNSTSQQANSTFQPTTLCQSAWAVDDDEGTRCHPRLDPTQYSYGWSNGPLHLEDGIIILDLFLEPKDCSQAATNVGTVWVSWDENRQELTVDFKIDTDGYYMKETNAYFGPKPLYASPTYQSIVSPQDYPLFNSNLTQATDDTHISPMISFESLARLQYLSAHAIVCNDKPVPLEEQRNTDPQVLHQALSSAGMRGAAAATTTASTRDKV